MRILYLGDIVGKKGLNAVKGHLNELRKEYKPTVVLVNAENVTNGKGLSENDYKELMKLNINSMTMGNHTFRQKSIIKFIDNAKICRPANLETEYGKGYQLLNINGKKLLVINLLGTIDIKMTEKVNNPFTEVDKIIEKNKADYIVVDFHAEATSEKMAMGYYLDGKVSAVVGTHTHIQTNDAKVLEQGTLYLSDLGMCGSLDGILGVKKDIILRRFLGIANDKFELEENGKVQINGCLLDLDNKKITLINKIYND